MLWLPAGLAGLARAQCSYDLNGVGYGTNCGYNGPGARAAPDPAAQERAREYQEYLREQRAKSAANAANNRGIEAYKKGDYAKALQEFRDANRTWAEDLYLRNIQLAASQLGIKIDVAAEQKLAGVDSAKTTQLTDMQRKAAAILANGTTAAGAPGNGMFGVQANPDKPALAKGKLATAKVNSALEQASSMADSGNTAVGVGGPAGSPNNLNTTDPEVMKAISGCGTDANPCTAPTTTGVAQPVIKSSAANELNDRLPDKAKQDPTIHQRMMDLDSYATHREEAERKIAVLDQKIKSGDPNADVLKAYQADLVTQVAADKKGESDSQAAIKDQMGNLGLDWVEAPAKPAEKPAGKQ